MELLYKEYNYFPYECVFTFWWLLTFNSPVSQLNCFYDVISVCTAINMTILNWLLVIVSLFISLSTLHHMFISSEQIPPNGYYNIHFFNFYQVAHGDPATLLSLNTDAVRSNLCWFCVMKHYITVFIYSFVRPFVPLGYLAYYGSIRLFRYKFMTRICIVDSNKDIVYSPMTLTRPKPNQLSANAQRLPINWREKTRISESGWLRFYFMLACTTHINMNWLNYVRFD